MGCGCKNCNGTVSSNSQLPPGCDSILSIDTELIGDNTLVTITFCSGSIQQFSIPSGQDGADGAAGSTGASGADGVSIIDIDSSVEGNIVTLTFLLSNGETLVEQFEINADGNDPAYVIDHKGIDVPNEDNISEQLDGSAKVIARSLLPANLFPNGEDTVYFDILININYNSALGAEKNGLSLFKNLRLELNNSSTASGSGINISFQDGAEKLGLFPTVALKFSGEITRRSYLDALGNVQTNGLDVVVEGHGLQRRSYPIDNLETGSPLEFPGKDASRLAWKLKDSSVDLSADNYLKIVAVGDNYTTDTASYIVTATQLYFTTRYLPRI